MKRRAVVAGATGLVGQALVALLLDDERYDEVTVLARRPSGYADPKLRERIVDFRSLAQADPALAGTDVFCALGTTIKKAGTREAFRQVDYAYPLSLGKLAKDQGAARMLIVTSLGANPHSRTFYLRVKGEVERDLRGLGLARLHVFRPSLLLGRREEFRLGERIMGALLPMFSGIMGSYRPVPAQAVAKAMLAAALSDRAGVHLHDSKQIIRAAREARGMRGGLDSQFR